MVPRAHLICGPCLPPPPPPPLAFKVPLLFAVLWGRLLLFWDALSLPLSPPFSYGTPCLLLTPILSSGPLHRTL